MAHGVQTDWAKRLYPYKYKLLAPSVQLPQQITLSELRMENDQSNLKELSCRTTSMLYP